MVKSAIKVGDFSEEDIRNGKDKKAIKEMKEKTNLKYINTKIIKKNGNKYLSIWLCNAAEFNI